ncbi:MAG: hypothetical protein PHW76_02680 [Alphaproteobacteria bacterium]|nr:hypothetical protein [Alphaproteobacteria bacterium]
MMSSPQANLVPHVIDLIGVSFDKKFASHQRMAGAIISVSLKKGCCEPQDLLPLGFTQKETSGMWHMAQAMANVELKLIKSTACQGYEREKEHAAI